MGIAVKQNCHRVDSYFGSQGVHMPKDFQYVICGCQGKVLKLRQYVVLNPIMALIGDGGLKMAQIWCYQLICSVSQALLAREI